MTEPDPFTGQWRDISSVLANQPTAAEPECKTEPKKTHDGPVQLTRVQKAIVSAVVAGALVIAALGFIGSYTAVAHLATTKGFGRFAHAFPIAIDAGIAVLLALDLVLTWLRMAYPLLRQAAWLLTGATIAFNAAASWGDGLAVGMHAVIPTIFVIVVEAARHAVGRIANITADRHIETPPLKRWIIGPLSTYRIWHRQLKWNLASYTEVIDIEWGATLHRAKLRSRHGRGWRRAAPAHDLLALKLARFGKPVHQTVAEHANEAIAQATQATEAQSQLDRIAEQKREASAAAESERLAAVTEAAEKAAEAERQAMRAAQERERAETDAKRAAEAREVAERRAETRRDRDRETTETPKRETKRDQPSETNNIAVIGDRETETARLLALMRDRKDPMKVSLSDAIRETGRPKATAAKRLAAARDLYLGETA